ncbi:GNAT family N-acetyltransferase [Myxococcus qinghaiensis]|uniref:GNAT family N-acetyltransferase n=1 Tax=Myxococcus qinghaiensis TaxID=2906758 RepID=UPI0020A71564|nr:GNAT family N-acetyltransferase [Myxococcus qinghaiensis]MCP3163231.1 GNAT family N-acetyltransferase [Myxococcus qinghaiensis]
MDLESTDVGVRGCFTRASGGGRGPRAVSGGGRVRAGAAMLRGTVPLASRPISPSDSDFLFALYASTREGELAAWGWTPAQAEVFLRMQWLARGRDWSARYPTAEDRVVLVDGQPAGRLLVARGEKEWRLVDIALLPAHRGGGLGTQLVHELLEAAGEARMCVRLHVLHDSPARKLYSRLGFQGEPGAREDSPYVAMEWTPASRAG